jgi:hypothetical protein
MSGPTYADVAASIGSTMDGSSFSGLLTRAKLATSALGRPGTVAFSIAMASSSSGLDLDVLALANLVALSRCRTHPTFVDLMETDFLRL